MSVTQGPCSADCHTAPVDSMSRIRARNVVMLMGAVGEPCAVNPDFTLRRAAEQANWPVVYYDD